jgi:predicted GNAT family N-acyltransferase
LRRVRRDVFVREQGVPEALEWDGRDAVCRHVVANDDKGAAIGCGRLLPDGGIGRLAVERAWRGRGVGSAILSRLVDIASNTGFERVVLNARTDAAAFYARRGFAAAGPEFTEAGIRHLRMERALPPAIAPKAARCAASRGKMR